LRQQRLRQGHSLAGVRRKPIRSDLLSKFGRYGSAANHHLDLVSKPGLFPLHESATVPKASFDEAMLERMAEIDITADGRVITYVGTMRLMDDGLPAGMMRGGYVTGPYTLAGLVMGREDDAPHRGHG
jgi:hypothetical protein